MSYGERIKEIRGAMSQEDFAKILGVHKNTLGRFEREEGRPNIEELNKILLSFPKINPEWLLTGKGVKEKIPTCIPFTQEEIDRNREESEKRTRDRGNSENVSFYSDSSGESKILNPQPDDSFFIPKFFKKTRLKTDIRSEQNVDFISLNKLWVKKEGISLDDLNIMKSITDNMSPTINRGDILLVSSSEEHTSYYNIYDGIYIFQIDGTLYPRRIIKESKNLLTVVNDNSIYNSSETISEDQINDDEYDIIGRVIWISSFV